MAPPLTIGQLAQATGVSAKTIRYYEQRGILPAPRRNASGYRQYDRHDVHRLLLIRRARALGLSLTHLKTLLADLDSEPCLAMRPHLQALVRAQLHSVQQQIAESHLLERQLMQVLQRLHSLPPSDHADGCRCLEVDGPGLRETSQPEPPLTSSTEAVNPSTTLESLTLLTTATGHCDCGCGCHDVPLTPLGLLLPSTTPTTKRRKPTQEKRLSGFKQAVEISDWFIMPWTKVQPEIV